VPQYTRRDGDAMRQDAIRRSREMYHRVVPPQESQASSYDFLPLRERAGCPQIVTTDPFVKKATADGAVWKLESDRITGKIWIKIRF